MKVKSGLELEKEENSRIEKWGIKYDVNNHDTNNEETHRTLYKRERDRILYTGGFRRLQDKTQVLTAIKSGDHRTRLTHTLEVEQIAYSLSDSLGLNRDLSSAIATGHDVGHTPFGHAAERKLNNLLEDQGGFSHAQQSIRYLLTQAHGKGIELSNEIVYGILNHDTDVYANGYSIEQYCVEGFEPGKQISLEAQVVYWSDKIAYITHDFEDFKKSDILRRALEDSSDSDLENKLKFALISLISGENWHDIHKKSMIVKDLDAFETRDLIRNILNELIKGSKKNIEKNTDLDAEEFKKETCESIKNIERDSLFPEVKDYKTIEEILTKIIEYKILNTINLDIIDDYIDIIDDYMKLYDVNGINNEELVYKDLDLIKLILIELENEFNSHILEEDISYWIEIRIKNYIDNMKKGVKKILNRVSTGNYSLNYVLKEINRNLIELEKKEIKEDIQEIYRVNKGNRDIIGKLNNSVNSIAEWNLFIKKIKEKYDSIIKIFEYNIEDCVDLLKYRVVVCHDQIISILNENMIINIEGFLENIVKEDFKDLDKKKKEIINGYKQMKAQKEKRNHINKALETLEKSNNIEDVLNEIEKKVKKKSYLNGLVINFDEEYRYLYLMLRDIIDDYYIFSPEVQKSDLKAEEMVEKLFRLFEKNYKVLPLNIRKEMDKLNKNERKRIIADYIASMTDKYIEQIYNNLDNISRDYDY